MVLLVYYPDVPMLEVPQRTLSRANSALMNWVKKPSPVKTDHDEEEKPEQDLEHAYDTDIPNDEEEVDLAKSKVGFGHILNSFLYLIDLQKHQSFAHILKIRIKQHILV